MCGLSQPPASYGCPREQSLVRHSGSGRWLDLPRGGLHPPFLCRLSYRTPGLVHTEKNSVRAYDLRFALELGDYSTQSVVRIRAKFGSCRSYSITSSARSSSGSGTARANALAVLRLITSSNLVGN